MEQWKSEAVKEKEKGNQHFKAGNYSKAIDSYTNAITFDSSNPVLFANRAQCYLNMKMYYECEKDCKDALALDDRLVKCYFRRGLARKHLHRYKESQEDFKTALEMDPENKQAHSELNHVERLLQNESVRIDAVQKSSKFQSKEPLRDVPVIELGHPSGGLNINLPESVPSTSFEFYRDWRQLKKEVDFQKRLEYLKMVEPQRLSQLFKHSLEPNVFSDILQCLKNCSDFKFVADVLQALSKIARFSSLVLFLEPSEKKALTDIWKAMQQSGAVDVSVLELISKNYEVSC